MNSRWIGRSIFAALFCSAAACGPKPPEGASRLLAGTHDREFQVSTERGVAYFVRGRYPDKTYLIAESLVDGKRIFKKRFDKRSLGTPLQASPDGRSILAPAEALGEAMGQAHSALLRIDAEGALRGELRLPPAASLAAAGGWGWPDGPMLALREEDASFRLMPLSADDPHDAAVTLGSGSLLALSERDRLVVLASTAAVTLFGPDGREARTLALGSRPYLVGWTGEGRVLAAYREKTGGQNTLEALDPVGKSRQALYRGRETPEAFVAAGGSLFVVSRSSAIQADEKGPRWLARYDLPSLSQRWRLPWTERPARLLALDEGKDLLYIEIDTPEVTALCSLKMDEHAVPSYKDWLDSADKGPLRHSAEFTVVRLIAILGPAALILGIIGLMVGA